MLSQTKIELQLHFSDSLITKWNFGWCWINRKNTNDIQILHSTHQIFYIRCIKNSTFYASKFLNFTHQKSYIGRIENPTFNASKIIHLTHQKSYIRRIKNLPLDASKILHSTHQKFAVKKLKKNWLLLDSELLMSLKSLASMNCNYSNEIHCEILFLFSLIVLRKTYKYLYIASLYWERLQIF